MTILITGGTGLIGSRLLRRFVDAGVDCRALVRPGKQVPAGATPVEGDLLDADSLKQAVEGVSAIVHLAAVFRTQNEDDIWRANLDGTKNLIAAAIAHAPQTRFVMASTGLVYDADASHPGLEDDATNPKLAYPASPVKSLPQFEVKRSVSRYLNPDEEARLYAVLQQWIEECPAHYRVKRLSLQCHPLEVDIAIGTGLSKADQYSLRWEWIDDEHRKIRIPQTKNNDALVVPMADRVYNAFKRLEEIQTEIDLLRHGEVRVRMVSDGRVFNIRENREWWEKAIKEAGIEDLRWHDLRHAAHLG